MTCVGVPLSVSRNHIIPPYSEKHNFTIHGLFQNVSHWSTENPHGFKHGTTYIKNGKFIFRHVPNRQSLPVMHPINGSGYAVKSSIKFGTGAAPMFKAGSNDGSDKGARMEFDGTEVIFRVTPGMNLLVGDNVTFTLPSFSNSPDPYDFRPNGDDLFGEIGKNVYIFDPDNNRTKNHKFYDLHNLFNIFTDLRAKATYSEGWTPFGGSDRRNAGAEGRANLRDLHLNSTITFTFTKPLICPNNTVCENGTLIDGSPGYGTRKDSIRWDWPKHATFGEDVITPLPVAWEAGKEFAVAIHRKNNISATCQFFANDGRFHFKIETQLNWTSMPWTRVESVESLGNGLGCDNNCGNHGVCKVGTDCQLYCECHEGYGFPVGGAQGGIDHNDDIGKFGGDFARQDCSKMTCPVDYSFATLATLGSNKTTSMDAHYRKECSDAGLCNRGTGKCECFEGFSGMACEFRTCLTGRGGVGGDGGGTEQCSGHGRCLPMKYLAAQPDALPLSETTHNKTMYWDERRVVFGDLTQMHDFSYTDQVKGAASVKAAWDARMISGCLCDSSWAVGLEAGETQEPEFFGADCSLRHCPSNYDPFVGKNETDCFNKMAPGGRGLGKEGNLCHVDCSNRGICDYQSGTCECFEGFFGRDCHYSSVDNTMKSSNLLQSTAYQTDRSKAEDLLEDQNIDSSYASSRHFGSSIGPA